MAAPLEDPGQKLTIEAQDAVAQLKLAELRKRERLLQRARTYRGRRWLSFVVFILAVRAVFVGLESYHRFVAIGTLAMVFALLHLHTTGINQRLDALIELLASERKSAEDEKRSSDEVTR